MRAGADLVALRETYTAFGWNDATPIYLRPAVIALYNRNPKGIRGFEDLLQGGMSIIVTEGAGVANTSATGVWDFIP